MPTLQCSYTEEGAELQEPDKIKGHAPESLLSSACSVLSLQVWHVSSHETSSRGSTTDKITNVTDVINNSKCYMHIMRLQAIRANLESSHAAKAGGFWSDASRRSLTEIWGELPGPD